MAGRRLSIGRIAAITAWTGAAVAWGTAAVSIAAASPESQSDEVPEASPPVSVPATTATMLAPVPQMPDSGLIVVRYTPVARPEAEVIVQRRVVQVAGPSTSGGTAPAPTKTKSSGS